MISFFILFHFQNEVGDDSGAADNEKYRETKKKRRRGRDVECDPALLYAERPIRSGNRRPGKGEIHVMRV